MVSSKDMHAFGFTLVKNQLFLDEGGGVDSAGSLPLLRRVEYGGKEKRR